MSSTILTSDSLSVVPDDDAGGLRSMAETVPLSSAPWRVQGVLSDPEDLDVFDIGPVSAGDRIRVDLNSVSGELPDAALALFDASGSLLLVNDHRNVYLGKTQPFIDLVIPRSQPAAYVAISLTPGFVLGGPFSLIASKEVGDPLPDQHPDTILLDFLGGNGVRIGSRQAVDVQPFDTKDISVDLFGLTGSVVADVVAKVRDDYEPFNVTILSTSEGTRYRPGMSRLYFGAYDPDLLGVAEGVDEFNATPSQQAIVFTDSFKVFMQVSPSLDEISQAIANVASHEIGHLMGMVHTEDPFGIMDVSANVRQLLLDQTFRRSPLFSSVFPIGFQDAPQYLLTTIGGDAEVARQKLRRADLEKDIESSVQFGGPPAREGIVFSSCGLDH